MLPESLRQQLTVAKHTQRLHARRTQRERSRATWGPHHCGAQRSLATRHPAQHCAQQHSALMQSKAVMIIVVVVTTTTST